MRMGEDAQTGARHRVPDIDLAAAVADRPGARLRSVRALRRRRRAARPVGGYVVVLQHPVTTEYEQALRARHRDAARGRRARHCPALWFWPNVDAGSDATSKAIRAFREARAARTMHFFRNMPPDGFPAAAGRKPRSWSATRAWRSARDRSSAFRRSTSATGRQDATWPPTWSTSGYDRAAIVEATRDQISHGRYASEHIYGDGLAGGRVATDARRMPALDREASVLLDRAPPPDRRSWRTTTPAPRKRGWNAAISAATTSSRRSPTPIGTASRRRPQRVTRCGLGIPRPSADRAAYASFYEAYVSPAGQCVPRTADRCQYRRGRSAHLRRGTRKTAGASAR